MIYFDSNKKAYGYDIKDCICSIDDETWQQYANTNNWDIVNGVFTDITNNPDYTEQINAAKTVKLADNSSKADTARYNQIFTLTIQEQECEFDTSKTTQADLLTAFAVTSTGATYDGWITNNGVALNLTAEDVNTISTKFKESSNIYPTWLSYYNQINACTTIAEVNAIQINYGE